MKKEEQIKQNAKIANAREDGQKMAIAAINQLLRKAGTGQRVWFDEHKARYSLLSNLYTLDAESVIRTDDT